MTALRNYPVTVLEAPPRSPVDSPVMVWQWACLETCISLVAEAQTTLTCFPGVSPKGQQNYDLFSFLCSGLFFFSFTVILYFVFASGLHVANVSDTLLVAAVMGSLVCSLDICGLWRQQTDVCSLMSMRQERVWFVNLFAC